ncbi:MAG TPA: hypothetical protein VM582_06775 [Candidatus Thermoplasmatota archaeon]|nr:hypothetical protein [Candidatus Thermoplasmatota archaeon]
MRPLLLLALLLAAPLAAAQATLESLEEPHAGIDKVWPIVVTEEQAGKQRPVVFRNAPTTPFTLVVYDATGTEVYERRGTRGVQTLPALDAGEYRFFVRGPGAFQVTMRAFERDGLEDFDGALGGTADAFVLAPSRDYNVTFTGSVRVEWWDMTSTPEDLTPPAERAARKGGAYVITVRGDDATPYAIALEATSAPAGDDTPGLGVGALLGILALLALRRRE